MTNEQRTCTVFKTDQANKLERNKELLVCSFISMSYIARTSLRLFIECRTGGKFSEQQSLCRYGVLRWNSRGVGWSARTCDQQKNPPEQLQEFEDKRDQHYRRIKYDNPVQRTLSILNNDVKNFYKNIKNLFSAGKPQEVDDPTIVSGNQTSLRNWPRTKNTVEDIWPSHCDVLVVGGGVMGSSVAYHLKERALQGLNVVVVEQDSMVSVKLKSNIW